MTSVSLELIGADGPVIVEGPLAGNHIFLDTLHAVTGRPVMTGGSGVTGTAAGTALLVLGRDARIASHSTIASLAPDSRIAAYAAEWRQISENEQG
jgi:sugar (pentulose or hexulose) kinase